MLVPIVDIEEFEKFGFKKCKKPYNECYYLCVARGIKMIFLSPEMIDIIKWEEDDPRVHSKANCKYKDDRTALEIMCELIQKNMVTCNYLKDRR